MRLTGQAVSAKEVTEWGVCNHVVEDHGRSVVEAPIEYAKMIADNSPDAVVVSRKGLKLGWEGLGVGDVSSLYLDGWSRRIYEWRRYG